MHAIYERFCLFLMRNFVEQQAWSKVSGNWFTHMLVEQIDSLSMGCEATCIELEGFKPIVSLQTSGHLHHQLGCMVSGLWVMLQDLTCPWFGGLDFSTLLCPVVPCEGEQANSGPEHQGHGTNRPGPDFIIAASSCWVSALLIVVQSWQVRGT